MRGGVLVALCVECGVIPLVLCTTIGRGVCCVTVYPSVLPLPHTAEAGC